ncbi:unnamed protein product [Eruca vesicaria subsp. sativa]|uniref:Uncharacterized protein n=1 Tax=Eruca vesicaria subsp. sativa TaxID=29727 RepID=A0ABC8L0U0_ERUVS|nr:unnamed protein product [Eruca vesicaria subsp. sativa]
MAMSRVFFSELRFSEARNVNKGGELISLDMLFLDEKTREKPWQSFGKLYTLNNLFREGAVYKLSVFVDARNNNHFKLAQEGSSSTSSKYGVLQKLEIVALSELNCYVLNSSHRRWSSCAKLR